MGLPEYLFRHNAPLDQRDITHDRIEWLHSKDMRASEAQQWADIMREPARPQPVLSGHRGGNERAIVREDGSDASIFREIMK